MARLATACIACRSKKRKCRRDQEDGPCNLCRSINKSCTLSKPPPYPTTVLSALSPSTVSNADSSQSRPEVLLPSQDLCNELVDLYFDMLHDKQHALFHKPSFLAMQRQGSAPKILILAIIALASRFSGNPVFNDASPWHRGRIYALQCKALFESRDDTISLVSLQACILLALLSAVEGDSDNESLYIALAIRMSFLLRLPTKLSADDIQKETELKVWWTLWMLDTWVSAGTFIPTQLAALSACQAPIDELVFDALTPDSYLGKISEAGSIERTLCETNSLWSQMIPLTEIVPHIHKLHDNIVRGSKNREHQIAEVDNIASNLDNWLHRLPQRFHFNSHNLSAHVEQGYGRTILALHIGYHHHRQLLYWPYLYESVGQHSSDCKTLSFAEQCRDHAIRLSDLLWIADSTAGCECLWTSIGHLLTISSSIHLHTLLFGQSETRNSQAKKLLLQNFALMIKLRRYWPSLDQSMARLRLFHQYCQENMNNTFKMSKSMLWFLHGYRTHPDDSFDTGVAGNELAANSREQSHRHADDEVWLWGWSNDALQDSSSTLNSFLVDSQP